MELFFILYLGLCVRVNPKCLPSSGQCCLSFQCVPEERQIRAQVMFPSSSVSASNAGSLHRFLPTLISPPWSNEAGARCHITHAIAVCIFFEMRSHCSVVQAGLELAAVLTQPPGCWGYRCVQPCPAPHFLLPLNIFIVLLPHPKIDSLVPDALCVAYKLFWSRSFILLIFLFSSVYWGLNLGPGTCQANTLPLSYSLCPFLN